MSTRSCQRWIAFGLAMFAANVAAMTNYRIVPVTGLDTAIGLADDGTVLGLIGTGTPAVRPAIWKDGVVTTLAPPAGAIAPYGPFGPALAISRGGRVAVNWQTNAQPVTAFYVGGALAGTSATTLTVMTAVNDAGDRAGYEPSVELDQIPYAIVADQAHFLIGDSPTVPSVVANDGRIVGSTVYNIGSPPGKPVQRALAWDRFDSPARVLPAPGPAAQGRCTAALGMNAAGSVVGWWSDAQSGPGDITCTGPRHATMWTWAGVPTDIGVPLASAGAAASIPTVQSPCSVGWTPWSVSGDCAVSISDDGAILLQGMTPVADVYLWENGVRFDIQSRIVNPNGRRIRAATQMNNARQILAEQPGAGGSPGIVLLDPTDAPLPVVAEVPTLQRPMLAALSLLIAAMATRAARRSRA